MATATPEKNIETKPRIGGNKNDARRLRREGLIPAVLYGAGLQPMTISVDPKQMKRILGSESGHNSIFDLTAGGDAGKAMIVDWQADPVKGVLKGEAPGVKLQGGILEQMMREVEIECLPADIPANIEGDVSQLAFGETIRVSDLPRIDKIKFITDATQAIAHVTAVKEVVVATPVEGAEVAATTAEPEVIKKGKQDAEGEAAGGEKDDKKAEKSDKKAEKSEKKK
jgi:large subunit ribosomal protein L25